MFFERYSKEVIEPFAIAVIAKSFDIKYAQYIHPTDNDDFDYITLDGLHAVEAVLVIPENEKKAYEYEVQLSKGKTHLRINRIKDAVIREDGSLLSYYGGSLRSLIASIKEAVNVKCNKAKRRKAIKAFETVDLCVCVQDGSLMDLHSYRIAGFDFSESQFDNIFFITPSYFFRYSKATGFEEYPRIV